MEKKYDFKPKQWVLARYKNNEWILCQFSHITKEGYFMMCGGYTYPYCIPYKGNEHLRGTTDDYVEPYEPKDGDFIYIICRYDDNSACPFVYIQKGNEGSYKDYYLFSCPSTKTLEREGERKFHYDCIIEEIRPATDEEKNQLLSKLHRINKDWNAEKKEIVDWTWEPEGGERYWYPFFSAMSGIFEPFSTTFEYDSFDESIAAQGRMCRTDEEATSLCDKLNEAIKNVK